jgi:hypothetical protein
MIPIVASFMIWQRRLARSRILRTCTAGLRASEMRGFQPGEHRVIEHRRPEGLCLRQHDCLGGMSFLRPRGGVVIRIPPREIRVQGRAIQGARIMNVKQGDEAAGGGEDYVGLQRIPQYFFY